MKAKELLSRYRSGERNFRGVDLSGESLRGMNLAGIDLSGANLNKTDLRSTKFTDARLVGTQLCEAKTGTQRRWMVLTLGVAMVLSAITSLFLGLITVLFLSSIVESTGNIADSRWGSVAFGIFGLGSVAITLYFNYRKGILATLSTVTVVAAVAIASSVAGTDTSTVVVCGAVAVAIAGAVGNAIAVTSAGAVGSAVAVAGAVGSAITVTATVIVAVANENEALTIVIAVVVVLLITAFNFLISRRALAGDLRDKIIRDLAVGLAALGGTSFHKANLTDANFSKATVKSAHFRNALLTRTCFHLTQKLHLSRAYKTPLANRTALNLLVSLCPEPGKSYVGLNLKGANLSNALLADINLTEADLSDATLEGADLQRADLTKLQALGTNFAQADLTAACLESWNIDSTTQLKGAICDHVYLLRNQQERRPNSGTFAPGEFTKLFEEVLNTIDLIFRDGMDWRAFMQTFQTLQVEQSGAKLEIQSIENKGDGVMVVRLNAAPDADKPAIHAAFKQEYALKLAAVEQEYKALLAGKDQALAQKEEIIELHRQKSADMTRIAESLAQRPVTVDVSATASSRAGDETINIEGNVDRSVVRIGDGDDEVTAAE
ncbi:MAG: pentapeptide repeat-containing protein [Cyanobacteria bacterium J06598_3]